MLIIRPNLFQELFLTTEIVILCGSSLVIDVTLGSNVWFCIIWKFMQFCFLIAWDLNGWISTNLFSKRSFIYFFHVYKEKFSILKFSPGTSYCIFPKMQFSLSTHSLLLCDWYFVHDKAKGRISKRVLQENESRQIFRKTNISYPLIRTRTRIWAYQGVRNVRFVEKLTFLFCS